MSERAVLDYVAKLTGRTLDVSDAFGLSSARKAQLAAWLRRSDIAFDYDAIDRPTTTVAAIMGSGGASAGSTSPLTAPTDVPVALTAPTVHLTGVGIGIDIESVANLPEAQDYRSHAFYIDNYSPRELTHCLVRPDERSSLCGLWAAKEAVLKAGGVIPATRGKLADIEIEHDVNGRPTFPGCELSISHEGGLAVAVCIRLGGTPR